MTLILNNILFYPHSRPVFISLIIYIKKLSVKYCTLISSHAKSLKLGVPFASTVFFSVHIGYISNVSQPHVARGCQSCHTDPE